MASHSTESNALSERSESKGLPTLPSHSTESNALSERRESKGHVLVERAGGRCHRRLRVHFIYILRCADDVLYVGETNDLELRLLQHQEGTSSRFTAERRPVRMVYAEEHPTRASALVRERQIKGWTRAKKEALIAGDRSLLKAL